MGGLPREVPYGQILRGKIFNVAVPFTNERPLDFVIEDDKFKGFYKIITKDDGFEGVINQETGRRQAPVVKIATEFKLRPAIVIQKNEFNNNPNYHMTIVLPITKIRKEDKNNEYVQGAIENNDVEYYHYLGKLLLHESLILINDPKRIHKNMLFATPKEIILSNDIMEEILVKFAKCFEIKKIKECDECEQNCKRCRYKLAVNK